MSVNNVNSLYQTQGIQGSTSYTTLSQDDGGGVDIGKLLLGGLGTVVTIGLGVAAYKSGKQSSLTKESDNVFTTMCNGVKNWLGKNGDDVAQAAKNDIPAECKTSLKTFFSGGELSSEQKQDIVDNANEISKVFSDKARKNATKADKLAEITKIEKDEDKLKTLAQFLGIKGELKFNKSGIDLSSSSLDDQAIIARKLKDTNGDSINDIITALQTKYANKQKNYDTAVGKIKDIRVEGITKTSDVFTNTTITKRLNRAGAAKTLAESCQDTSSYINTQNSLNKWKDAGDLTKDEYDNLMALAEQKFMDKNSGKDYLEYLSQTLKKADGPEIDFNSLNEDSIKFLNEKFPGLNLNQDTSGTKTSLTAQQLIDWKLKNTKSISEYLGLKGTQIPSGWTIKNNALHFKGSSTPSYTNIGTIKIHNFDDYKNMSEGNITGYTINLDNLKKIFESTTALSL